MRYLSLTIAITLLPVSVRGALTLRIEDVLVCPGETTFAEIYFEETAPAEDEDLGVYTVRLGIVGDPGVRFGPATGVSETVRHPFVQPTPPFVIEPLEVTDRSLYVFVDAPRSIIEGVNVPDGAGVLRIPITAAPGAPAGRASLVFDLGAPPDERTAFVTEAGDLIAVTLQNGTVTVCPEPASTAVVLSAAGLVALRRRRGRGPGR